MTIINTNNLQLNDYKNSYRILMNLNIYLTKRWDFNRYWHSESELQYLLKGKATPQNLRTGTWPPDAI